MTHSVNQPAALADEWFTPGRFFALLALCLFAAFPEVVLGSHTFYYRDFGHFAYPLAHYHRDCFWRGEIPLWNPYNSCGLPHLAQWNTMCLYPGALIYLLGPMPWALGLFSLAHLMLAGAGAYQLAHHWTGNRFAASIAGLAFAFNGFTLHAVMWPNNVAALAWAPWLWLLVGRACKEGGRTILLAALVGAMQMLAGAPEVILFTWAIAVPLALGKVFSVQCSVFSGSLESAPTTKPPRTKSEHWILNTEYLSRFAGIAALVTLLSAAQLLPFLDLLQHSHRSSAFDAGHDTMPLSGWANFLVPLFKMTPDRNGVFTQLNQQWASSYYPGLGVLALAALAIWRRREPRVWLLALVAVLGVWLAMGEKAILLDWLKAICPPLGFIRFPIKYVLLPLMALPFLAAFGVALMRQPTQPTEQLAKNPNGEVRPPWLQPFTRVALVLFAGCGGVLYWASMEKSAATWPAVSSQVFVALTLLALLTGLLTRGLKFAPGLRFRPEWAILGLLAADIALHAPRQNPAVIPHAYEPDLAKFHTAMPRLGEGRAHITREMEGFMAHASNPDALNYIIGARRALFANWNLLEGVPKANGFFSLYPREQAETKRLLYDLDQPFPERFADFLGLTRASSSDALFTWAHRTTALPLITAGQRPEFAAAEISLPAMAGTNWNSAKTVFLHPWDEALVPSAGDLQSPSVANESTERRLQNACTVTAKVLSTKWTAQRIECEVESPAPTLVVIAQSFYHPWKATVNGQPANLLRANHAFQAVPVPAGRSTVRLEYVDHHFRLGIVLSALGLIACIVLWWRSRPSAALITNH